MFLSNATEEEIELLHNRVSKNVKYYRLKKGMSQLELALTIGMKSAAFFGNAENNTNDKHFNIEHIYKISKALNVSMATLLEPQEDLLIETS